MPKQPNINRLTTVCMWTDHIGILVSPSLIWPQRKKVAETAAARSVALTLLAHMHKGCTRDAQGTKTPAVPCHQRGDEAGCLAGSGGSPHARGDMPRQSAVAAMTKYALRQMSNSQGASFLLPNYLPTGGLALFAGQPEASFLPFWGMQKGKVRFRRPTADEQTVLLGMSLKLLVRPQDIQKCDQLLI